MVDVEVADGAGPSTTLASTLSVMRTRRARAPVAGGEVIERLNLASGQHPGKERQAGGAPPALRQHCPARVVNSLRAVAVSQAP